MNYFKQQVKNFLQWLTPREDVNSSIHSEAQQIICYLQLNYTDEQVTDIIHNATLILEQEKHNSIHLLKNEIQRKEDDLRNYSSLLNNKES